MPAWLTNLFPIILLLAAIALVLSRLPKVEIGHSDAFKKRRFWNWFPLGMTYAFLYFARYNINEASSSTTRPSARSSRWARGSTGCHS